MRRLSLVTGLVVLLTWGLIFKPVLFDGKTLFPGNLLVSFYQPWASEVQSGWEHGVPNKPNGIDNIRLYEPYRRLIRSAFARGVWPLWNPYSFSGNYLLGQSEGGAFYPLFLLLLWLPASVAWNIALMLEPVLTGLGMWLFLRMIVKNRIAAAYGAMVWALCGVVIVRMFEALIIGHTLIWLPFVFYGLEGWMQKRRVRYLVVTEIALALSVLAGWFQYAFYICLISGIYSLWRSGKLNLEIKIGWLWVYVCLPFITLIQLFPAYQAFTDSVRGTRIESGLLDTHLMPIQHILTLIFPDIWGNPGAYNFFGKSEYKEAILYIGVVPFVLAIFASLVNKANWYINFFVAVTAITIFLGLDTPLSCWLWSLPIPIVSSFLPNRIFILSAFGLSVLAAFGLEYVIDNRNRFDRRIFIKVAWFPGFLVALIGIFVGFSYLYKWSINRMEYKDLGEKIYEILVSAGGILRPDNLETISRNSLLPVAILISLAIIFVWGRKRVGVLYFFIILLTAVGQWYFAQKYLFFSEREFGLDEHPVFTYLQNKGGIDRFMTVGESYVFANIPAAYDLYSADGLAAMYPLRYAQLVGFMQNRGKESDAPRVEVRLNPSAKTLFEERDKYLLRFMEITGIKYIVKLKEEKFNKNEQYPTQTGSAVFPLVWENEKWQIFEHKRVWPRYLWTNKYKIETDRQKLFAELFDENNQAGLIYLEENPGLIAPIETANGEVSLLSYRPEEIVLQVRSDLDGLVYLSDNNSKLFKAMVDDQHVKILNANWTYRAVVVPKGNHVVKIVYDMEPIRLSGYISLGAVVVFGMGLYILSRKKTHYEKA